MMSTDLERKLVDDIIPLVADLHAIEQRADLSVSDMALVKHALLSAKISRLNVFSSQRAERISRRLLCLTWVLTGLTVVLLLLTIYLCADAYDKRTGNHLQQFGQSQQPSSPPQKLGADKE